MLVPAPVKTNCTCHGRSATAYHLAHGLIAAIVLGYAALTGYAQQSVQLEWDANTESDLAGYKVYFGQASTNYSAPVDVGNTTTASVSNLSEGATYYFAVTAYSTSGLESPFSQEVVYTVPFSGSDTNDSGGDTTLTNLPPVAAVDFVVLPQGENASQLVVGSSSVLYNDSDPEGQPLSATLVTPPASGSLVFNSNGTFQYQHNGGASLTDSFAYAVSDGTNTSSSVTVSISIFRVANIAKSGSDILISYPTVSNATYTVEYNTTSPDRNAAWSMLVGGIAGNGSIQETLHTGGASLAKVFYRIVCSSPSGIFRTRPFGSYAMSLVQGANSISLPLHRFATFRGLVSSVSTDTITVAHQPWTTGEFGPKNGFHQFMVILRNSASGNNVGDWWPILSSTANSIRVDTRGTDLSTLLRSTDLIEIRQLNSVADLVGKGLSTSSTQLNPDRNGVPLASEEDIIRYVDGASLRYQIISHDGSLAPSGYYAFTPSSTLGPLDGSTLTMSPDQVFVLFRAKNTLLTHLLGEVEPGPFTYYMNRTGNGLGNVYAADLMVAANCLENCNWTSDTSGVGSYGGADVIRPINGVFLAPEVFYHNGSLAPAGWYANGKLTPNFSLATGKGYLVLQGSAKEIIWRTTSPYAP